MAAAPGGGGAGGPAASAGAQGPIVLCLEVSACLVEPMCSSVQLQQELVPFVMSHCMQSDKFLGLPKPERQARVKALTQRMLSGERGGGEATSDPEAEGEDFAEAGPRRFWAHLRAKYGTRQSHLAGMLRQLEPRLRARRVVALRFETEAANPTASLLARASVPCRAAEASGRAPSAHRREFDVGGFRAEAFQTWLDEASGTERYPPLWSRLSAECAGLADEAGHAVVLCTEPQSSGSSPEGLALAGRAMHQAGSVPYISGVTLGYQSSERLAALEELCAWSGGLAFNIAEPAALQSAADGLGALLGEGGASSTAAERRRYYAQKQSISSCFLTLPALVPGDASSSTSPKGDNGIAELLLRCKEVEFDSTIPSEATLAVLSDVTTGLPRRWARSLRCWRMERGLRDVVFGEPGGLGLELDEPRLAEGAPPHERRWRLRATHPPASALKMENQSVLLAINQARVTEHTARSEVARRVAVRPVSLTFQNPPGSGVQVGGMPARETFSMVVAEIVVSELREGLPPLKKDAPPLSTALQRVAAANAAAAAKGCPPLPQRQAGRLLERASRLGPAEGRGVAEPHALARVPALLFRVMLLCGDVAALAHCGGACYGWRGLLMEGARDRAGGAGSSVQGRLWQWALRWGGGPAPARRLGFWRWALGLPPRGAAAGARGAPAEAVLRAAARVDAQGLLQLSHGLAGTPHGLQVAAAALERLAAAAGEAAAGGLPTDVLEALMGAPLHAQRCWLLSAEALPWLVLQCRCFQIAIAAHRPLLFRHLLAEGVAPELFYCSWIQGLFAACAPGGALARLWDLWVFEGSHKVFVRTAVAVFGLLEKRMLGKDVEFIMRFLRDPEAWQLDEDTIVTAALETKVTRSMLRHFEEGPAA